MTKCLSGKKSIDDLVRKARKLGWDVRRNASAHWTFYPPDKTQRIIVCSKQPTDFHAIHNIIRDLKRSGLPL